FRSLVIIFTGVAVFVIFLRLRIRVAGIILFLPAWCLPPFIIIHRWFMVPTNRDFGSVVLARATLALLLRISRLVSLRLVIRCLAFNLWLRSFRLGSLGLRGLMPVSLGVRVFRLGHRKRWLRLSALVAVGLGHGKRRLFRLRLVIRGIFFGPVTGVLSEVETNFGFIA